MLKQPLTPPYKSLAVFGVFVFMEKCMRSKEKNQDLSQVLVAYACKSY
jgi:hypothetical protein